MSQSWTRLIRFVSESGQELYGEPLLKDDEAADIGVANAPTLKARIFRGANPLSLVETDQVETVAQLLGPLRVKDVPLIRCIGLNYKTHSEFAHCRSVVMLNSNSSP